MVDDGCSMTSTSASAASCEAHCKVLLPKEKGNNEDVFLKISYSRFMHKLEDLKHIICQAVPKLQNKNFRLRYMDDDNDVVLVVSNEDLEEVGKSPLQNGLKFTIVLAEEEPPEAQDDMLVGSNNITCPSPARKAVSTSSTISEELYFDALFYGTAAISFTNALHFAGMGNGQSLVRWDVSHMPPGKHDVSCLLLAYKNNATNSTHLFFAGVSGGIENVESDDAARLREVLPCFKDFPKVTVGGSSPNYYEPGHWLRYKMGEVEISGVPNEHFYLVPPEDGGGVPPFIRDLKLTYVGPSSESTKLP